MAYRPSAGRNQKAASEPKQPDLVPIMNLFLAIIPFLLLMLVISQVALVALNFTSTGGGGGGADNNAGGGGQDIKKVQVIIMDTDDAARGLFKGFEIREPGADSQRIPAVNGQFDWAGLDNNLKSLRSRNPELRDINVLVYPEVLYGALMKTIDLCKVNTFVNVHYEVPRVSYYQRG